MENNIVTLKKGFVVDTSALMEHPDIVDRVDGLDNESNNRIVGEAVWLQEYNPFAEISLVTTDRNMRIVASGYGLSNSTDREIECSNFCPGKEIPKWRSVLKLIVIVLLVPSAAFLVAAFTPLPGILLTAGAIANLSVLAFVLFFFGCVIYGIRRGNTKRYLRATAGDWLESSDLSSDKAIEFSLRNQNGSHRWGQLS